MSKYIDADALINQRPENLNNRCENYDKAVYASGWNDCNKCWCDLIDEMPAADVEPVRHGKWVKAECSICGAQEATDSFFDYLGEKDQKYCYSCGAKMDEDSEE